MKDCYVIIVFLLSLLFCACDFKLKPFTEDNNHAIEVCRYDRLQSQYLATGDFSALQQMNTEYPMETRTLIEDVLQIGEINDPRINNKFLAFFQDSTLQALVSDAEAAYANMDDINNSFDNAFTKLKMLIPELPVPHIYAQISALNQSIIIGDKSIGISLDKYLGEDYPLYKRFHYSVAQLKTMTRSSIVPDALCFYLLSLYPIHDFETCSQDERDLHFGKIMWSCNKALESSFFKTNHIDAVEAYMHSHKEVSVEELLTDNNREAIMAYYKK